MMKKAKDARLKYVKAFSAANRTPMPRPTVFKDKTKYDRKANKQRILREVW